MSRIRNIVAKSQKIVQGNGCEESTNTTNNEDEDTLCTKDEGEKAAMRELTSRLPRLGALFTLHRKVGEGTFSSVYLGSLRAAAPSPVHDRRLFAIKHLVPGAHPARVEHELRCLRDMGGLHHVVPLELCLRHLDTVVIVMPYIPHTKFSEYVSLMDAAELAAYLRALLLALRHVHSFGVIHRDVKPSNFLYDRARRRYQLVDFGLAQRVMPSPTQAPTKAVTASATDTATHHAAKRERTEEGSLPIAKKMALGPLPAPNGVSAAMCAPLGPLPAPNVVSAAMCAPSASPAHSIAPAPCQPKSLPVASVSCACFGVSGICARCTALGGMRAPRAGTQGFRPPEVLLKCPRQGPAVDIWAVGIILCSVLCARYPLLRAADDASALAELCGLLGTRSLLRAAHALRRRLLVSGPRPQLCLRKLASRLRGNTAATAHTDATVCRQCHVSPCLCRSESPPPPWTCGFPSAAFALCERLLEPDPLLRPTADDALAHPFLNIDVQGVDVRV